MRSEKTWRIKLWYKTVATAQFHDTKMKRSETMKTLKEVACGSTVKVKKLTGEGPVKRRIMDMGITKGVVIYVRKVHFRCRGPERCFLPVGTGAPR